MTCKSELKDLLGKFLRGLLSEDQSRAVQEHLKQCSECASELEVARKLLPGLEYLTEQHIPVDLLVAYQHKTLDYRSKEPGEWKKEEIEEHLDLCEDCQFELQQLKAFEEYDAGLSPVETVSKVASHPKLGLKKFLSTIPTYFASRKLRYAVVIATVLIILIIPTFLLRSQGPMIAVLPFEYVGPAEKEAFADGIIDDISVKLEKVSSLGCISSTSTYKYKNSKKSLKEIGDELGVDYLLLGTFRWEISDGKDKITIKPNLIAIQNQAQVWSENYSGSLNEIFAIQSEIIRKITIASKVVLSDQENRYIETKPTDNIEAYYHFLLGNISFKRRQHPEDLKVSIQMYKKAIELDSNFALAYTGLSRAFTEMYWHYKDWFSEAEQVSFLSGAKRTVDKAFKLQRDLPEAHLALGSYYYHEFDNDYALKEFAIAQKSLPNNSDLYEEIAYTLRRQGNWGKAFDNLKKALELDPNSVIKSLELARICKVLRQYPEAESYYNRAISLEPDWLTPYADKADLYVRWQGNTEKARKTLEEKLETVESDQLDILEGNYQKVLKRHTQAGKDSLSYFIIKAQVYRFMNQPKLMQTYYDSVRVILERRVQTHPEDAGLHSELGIAYATLGRKAEAIQEGKKGLELWPLSKEWLPGTAYIENLAQIYVLLGEYDAAIDQLEYLLSIPGYLSKAYLRIDPAWAPLRDHPRFQKLLKREASRV